jgi:hypothetical protein
LVISPTERSQATSMLCPNCTSKPVTPEFGFPTSEKSLWQQLV